MNRFSPKKSCRSRRGYTLLEMMVVVAVGSVIFGVAVVSLAMLWRIDSRLRTDEQLATVRQRLAEQFRADTRAAADWTVESSGNGVVIRLQRGDNSAVEYTIRSHVVERRLTSNGRLSASDRFDLREGTSCEVTLDNRAAGRRLLQLKLDCPVDDGRSGARREYFVLARLGADHRFTAGEEGQP